MVKNKSQKEIIEYGIKRYSKDQLSLHKDIMKLLESARYEEISADDCLIVFGRIYAMYVMSQLIKEGKIAKKNETD
jgi:hypothetical protein